MSLTLEKPETEARLLRFAQKRGIPLDDLIDDLLDSAEEIEPAEGEDLDELTTAVNEGLAAIKAGEKGLTPEEMDTRMKAKFPFLKDRKAA